VNQHVQTVLSAGTNHVPHDSTDHGWRGISLGQLSSL